MNNITEISTIRINSVEDELYERVNNLYIEAFIPEERRESLESIISKKDLYVNAIIRNEEFVGFFNYWDFDTYTFLEHIATLPSVRGGGIGEIVFKELLPSNKMIIAEVEPPELNEVAKRRVGFYERVGFIVNLYSYEQPAYQVGKEAVEMRVISYPKELSEDEFNKISTEIHRVVYGKL